MSFFENLVSWATALKPIAEVFVLFTMPFAAGWTIFTYQRSVKLERAKWIKDLYEKFYEHDELKRVRDVLDSADHQQVHNMVEKEATAFTDYLNFFEFLGYLWESDQITTEEITGLFDYYLRCIKNNIEVAEYIRVPEKGFEKLRRMLEEMIEEVRTK